jgi:hypothetical protein
MYYSKSPRERLAMMMMVDDWRVDDLFTSTHNSQSWLFTTETHSGSHKAEFTTKSVQQGHWWSTTQPLSLRHRHGCREIRSDVAAAPINSWRHWERERGGGERKKDERRKQRWMEPGTCRIRVSYPARSSWLHQFLLLQNWVLLLDLQ